MELSRCRRSGLVQSVYPRKRPYLYRPNVRTFDLLDYFDREHELKEVEKEKSQRLKGEESEQDRFSMLMESFRIRSFADQRGLDEKKRQLETFGYLFDHYDHEFALIETPRGKVSLYFQFPVVLTVNGFARLPQTNPYSGLVKSTMSASEIEFLRSKLAFWTEERRNKSLEMPSYRQEISSFLEDSRVWKSLEAELRKALPQEPEGSLVTKIGLYRLSLANNDVYDPVRARPGGKLVIRIGVDAKGRMMLREDRELEPFLKVNLILPQEEEEELVRVFGSSPSKEKDQKEEVEEVINFRDDPLPPKSCEKIKFISETKRNVLFDHFINAAVGHTEFDLLTEMKELKIWDWKEEE